ncbi:hypothetical protein [Saccharopolyspora gregorii]
MAGITRGTADSLLDGRRRAGTGTSAPPADRRRRGPSSPRTGSR